MNASAAFQPTKGFINTATEIISGKKITDAAQSSYMPLWEFLGFEDARAMQERLEKSYSDHERILEEIADRSSLVEQLAVIPEGFVTPNGKVIGGKLSKADIANNVSASNNKSEAEGSSGNLFASIMKPSSLPDMTTAPSVGEGDQDIQPCGPGTACGNLKKAANKISGDIAMTVSDTDASPRSMSNASVSPAASGFVGNTNFNSFLHSTNRAPASIRRPVTVASTSVANDPNKQEKDQVENQRFDTNPPINQVGASTPTNQIRGSTSIDQDEVTINDNIFNVMPEGWFSHVQPDMGVEIRGALDTPYIPETDGKENHKNFIQIAIKDSRYGLDPGVYTIKKCRECLNSYYSDYLDGLKRIAAGEKNVNLSIPAVVEALSVLRIIKDGYKKKSDFVAESKIHLKTLNSIFNNSPELARAKPRYNIFEYLAPLREKNKGRLSEKSSEFIKLKNDITFLETLNKRKKIKL